MSYRMSKWSSFLAGTILVVGLVGCGDDTESNNEAGNNGENVDPYERPEGARTIISDEKLAEIEELGMPIYGGLNPPDVSGSYVFDSREWTVAPRAENEGTDVCDAEATWTVESDGTLSTEIVYTSCSGSGSSSGVFLSGADDCFTTYSQGDQTFEGCERTGTTVTSACLGTEGLTDYAAAFFDTSHGAENCESLVNEGRLPPVGGIVITEEIDGLVAFGN